MKETLTKIGPGMYVGVPGNTLHLVVPELLEAHHYADTPENRAILVEAAQHVIRDKWGDDVPVKVDG